MRRHTQGSNLVPVLKSLAERRSRAASESVHEPILRLTNSARGNVVVGLTQAFINHILHAGRITMVFLFPFGIRHGGEYEDNLDDLDRVSEDAT